MILTEELTNRVLIQPAINGADRLRIIAGYATPQMASWHIQRLNDLHIDPIKVDLIVGMTVDNGIEQMLHDGFIDVTKRYRHIEGYSSFKCQYIYQGLPVNSKLYLWEKSGKLVEVFVGSADYTQYSFNSHRQKECMAKLKDNRGVIQYFNSIEKDSVYCTLSDIEDYIKIYARKKSLTLAEEFSKTQDISNRLTLSLLTSKGDRVGARSGLNWGQRENRERNQAYIPLPRDKAQSGFFPVKKIGDEKAPHFTVITDDSKSLVLRVEQDGDKAITTPENNSRLGEYFRNRLSLPNGAPVTKEDLLKYGRTDVEFIKLDDEQYYMDFSVRK
ncbi:MAG: restriction endonuclease PLD domain-containing protein [Saccharofermentanales bacterium]